MSMASRVPYRPCNMGGASSGISSSLLRAGVSVVTRFCNSTLLRSLHVVPDSFIFTFFAVSTLVETRVRSPAICAMWSASCCRTCAVVWCRSPSTHVWHCMYPWCSSHATEGFTALSSVAPTLTRRLSRVPRKLPTTSSTCKSMILLRIASPSPWSSSAARYRAWASRYRERDAWPSCAAAHTCCSVPGVVIGTAVFTSVLKSPSITTRYTAPASSDIADTRRAEHFVPSPSPLRTRLCSEAVLLSLYTLFFLSMSATCVMTALISSVLSVANCIAASTLLFKAPTRPATTVSGSVWALCCKNAAINPTGAHAARTLLLISVASLISASSGCSRNAHVPPLLSSSYSCTRTPLPDASVCRLSVPTSVHCGHIVPAAARPAVTACLAT